MLRPQVLIEHQESAIRSVQAQVDGSSLTATRQSYDVVEPPGGKVGSASCAHPFSCQ